MNISKIFGLVTVRDDHGKDANFSMISVDILTKNEVVLTNSAARGTDRKALMIKPMASVREIVPNNITAIKFAKTVMTERRLK